MEKEEHIFFSNLCHMHLSSPGPEVMTLFSCSDQLNTILIMLINVKMPTIGSLTFISKINTTSGCFKQVKINTFSVFYFL